MSQRDQQHTKLNQKEQPVHFVIHVNEARGLTDCGQNHGITYLTCH